jgi:CheY-like chemotaxis protein
MMPEMDGWTLAQKIQQHPELVDSRLIMLSSSFPQLDAAETRDLGIQCCLTKPVRQSSLLSAISKVLALEPASADSVPAAPPAVSSPARPLHILLAEDGLVNQKVVVRMLQQRGHTVDVTQNGVEALAAFKAAVKQPFDLVLMDVRMPEMDGLAATKAIRCEEQQRGGHIPIVAMTASAMKGDREACLAAGMDGYIAKPIHTLELYRAVESIVDVQTVEAVAASPEAASAPRVNPQPAPEASAVIDTQAALRYAGGSPKTLKEFSDIFYEEYPRLMERIRQAISNGEASELKLAAHTLKGTLELLGGDAARQTAQRLEQMGRDNQWVDVEAAWSELDQRIGKFRAALGEFLRQQSL